MSEVHLFGEDGVPSQRGAPPGPSPEALYQASRVRRKQKTRHGEGQEIDALNITPMLDMMTIILVFLLKSFSVSASDVNVANLTLPVSKTRLKIEEAVQLIVTKSDLLVDQKPVTKLESGQVRVEDLPDGPNGYLIGPLYDALESKAEHLKKIEKYGGAQFNGRIALIADKDLDYRLLFKVMYTCGRAEFGQFKLFVAKPQGID